MSAPDLIEGRFQGTLGALDLDVAFAVPVQGVTALFGPSGAGKTSLLRCVAGLERVAGYLSVQGVVWQDARTFRPVWTRPLGYVAQDPGLLTHLDVRGNLAFGLKRSGAPTRLAFDDVVARLGLASLLDRSVTRLSGGEARRVAIGRALLSQPRLLMLDEPLAGLDVHAKAVILDSLDDLSRSLDLPILLVSHDPTEVARLADRVLVMRAGRIVQATAASPQAVREAVDAHAARDHLAGVDANRVSRLALAALIAGLPPADLG